MIIWLASFPRSGNTLLRQVLADIFKLPSYSDEPSDGSEIDWAPGVRQRSGITSAGKPWSDFYRDASASTTLHLVKTHRLPCDGQPAIYVVRDGRRVMTSYEKFHQSFSLSGQYPDLMSLVLGLDFYGSWSDHFRAWMGRQGETLLLRYENLVNPSNETLSRLSEFVNANVVVDKWSNPFEELHAMDPRFFRRGEVAWQPESGWTDAIDQLFFYCHGDLMVELGYSTAEEIAAIRQKIAPAQVSLIDVVRRLERHRAELQTVCDERLIVIERLKAACDERLDLINRLNSRWI